MDLGLAGKCALVMGASRGLGREVTLLYAAEGVDTVICGRDRTALDSVASQARAFGARCTVVVADLAQDGVPSEVVKRAAEECGRLDIVVHSAAGAASADAQTSPSSRVLARIKEKAIPAIAAAQAAVAHLTRPGGSIVLVGGTSARTAFTAYGPFIAMKSGESSVAQGMGNAMIANFAKHLSDEVAGDGITVNVVEPGFMRTSRGESRISEYAASEGVTVESVEASIAAACPLGRVIEPVDVAPVIVFLTSVHARAITGQSLAVDGGTARAISY